MDDTAAFETTHRFAFFDYFRVPYQVAPPGRLPPVRQLPVGMGQLRPAGAPGPSMFWSLPERRSGRTVQRGRFALGDALLAGRVVRDDDVRIQLGETGRAGVWRPAEPICDPTGARIASVWRHGGDGSVLLPFDPGDVMTTLWSEAYRDTSASLVRNGALRAYYLMRPALPRAVQLRLRRRFTRVQGRSTFPRWPMEDGLHDLYAWLFELLADLAGGPVSWLGFWPDGREWALVLTHDVETADGVRRRDLLREPERQLGLPSSWNLVRERYHVDDSVVRQWQDDGCEIGVHGLRHDGRDLGSTRLLRRRLPAMRGAARRWGAVGFRSPATQRRWEWMPKLGFAYDSSYPDTDPYEPQPGGCCTILPFFNEDTVELPITLPQDHTLFAVLGQPDGTIWLDKTRHIRNRGGMALVLTHPDYASDQRVTAAYTTLLGTFATDPDVWCALPRDVASWWRRRNSSVLVRAGADQWKIAGPAASDGRVRFGGTGPPASIS